MRHAFHSVETPTLARPSLVPFPSPASGSSRDAAYAWMSLVRAHSLTLEHAAVDIDTDHVLYHMELTFEAPLPPNARDHAQFLCLTWPYGGLWKIESVSDDNTRVACLSWRKTELKHDQVDDHAREVDTLRAKVEDLQSSVSEADAVQEVPPSEGGEGELQHLFGWKMMRGTWGEDDDHWFIRDIAPPDAGIEAPSRRHLIAKLFVCFAPLEARIEVNAVTAIDTVAQTYSADVTWQITLPAITALREDTVLLEFLDLLEIDANQFEFSNVNEMKDERALTSSVTPAGEVQFRDLTLPGIQAIDRPHVENVYHLQFSRRVIASFTEEMALHSFPFDQQKLIFEFSTGSSGMPDGALQLIPAPVEPGSFSIEDFQLGNVFDVAYYNKIFVSEIKEWGPRKSIAFEMVLERRSYYYITNVALIAAVITYLCFFVSWSPENGSDGDLVLMDTGSRLQNVTAMVLTAVTFKNQVASLIPQISYFTMLDRYVFVCFMVTSFVTIENSLFPLISRHVIGEKYSEGSLLGYSLAAFTLLNLVWAIYVRWWLNRRRHAAKVLMQVHEYIRLLTDLVPASDRKHVLERFLAEKDFAEWCRPNYIVTSSGDIHVQAPDDTPAANTDAKLKRVSSFHELQHEALKEVNTLQRIYSELRPGNASRRVSPSPLTSNAPHKIAAARTDAAVYQAGTLHVARMSSVVTQASHQTAPRLRRQFSANDAEDAAAVSEAVRRFRTHTQHQSRRVL